MEFNRRTAAQPQVNVIARAIEAIGAAGDGGVLEGFCAVVSGFVAAAVAGGVLDARYMRKRMMKRMELAGFDR